MGSNKMSFETLNRILHRPTEKYILQTKKVFTEEIYPQKVLKDEVGNIIQKDEVGNIKEEWTDLQELTGVIQHRQREDISDAGQESKLRYGRMGYLGYFNPDFELETDRLADYRVKFIRDYEILYLRIMEYDPNNYLRNKQHHIVLGLIEDKKYFGRAE